MKAVTGKRFARLLEQHGWNLMRIQGSHHIFAKPGRAERISLPTDGNTPLKAGLQRHLMRIAEIPEDEL